MPRCTCQDMKYFDCPCEPRGTQDDASHNGCQDMRHSYCLCERCFKVISFSRVTCPYHRKEYCKCKVPIFSPKREYLHHPFCKLSVAERKLLY
jgi:hypothetical protein